MLCEYAGASLHATLKYLGVLSTPKHPLVYALDIYGHPVPAVRLGGLASLANDTFAVLNVVLSTMKVRALH